MKQKIHKRMFWGILTMLNLVAVIYIVNLWVRVAEDDAQAIPGKVALGIVLLLVIIDAASVLVDYRRWRADVPPPQRMSPWRAVNVEVIICAAGTALVMYGERRIVSYEILCDGPATMLQAGLVSAQHVGNISRQAGTMTDVRNHRAE
jgi:hypothetical protein